MKYQTWVTPAIWREFQRRRKERQAKQKIIAQVREGKMSIRYAAAVLDLTVDDVSEMAFGEVVV